MVVSYPDRMPHDCPRLRTVLRTGLLALLMLGVMFRPMVNQLSVLHDVEHATQSGVNDHGHDQPDDRESMPDPDHATGSHGLIHHTDTSPTANIWTAWATVPAIPAASKLPLADLGSTRRQELTSPFRPPIV